ncbi:MAG: sigma-70 family RNA polymerase sigma factor [Eubacteriales bacterium]|nr:sigma-70 family RNA polymerase sigma factor [Eubacteriales bacterium]
MPDTISQWVCHNYETDGIDAFLPYRNHVGNPELKKNEKMVSHTRSPHCVSLVSRKSHRNTKEERLMPRYNRYYPNYEKLYPGIEKCPEILRVLRASDRKMRYMEQGLKSERRVVDQEKQAVVILPSRETSLEQLTVDEQRQFSDGSKPEEQVLRQEELRLLRQALRSLEKEYQALLYYRYWKDMSQEEVAKLLSLTQQAVSRRERYALHRLKVFVQNGENRKF